MLKYSNNEIKEEARAKNFITDTYEKVLRLYDVLNHISEIRFGEMPVLKGGTAINLWFLNMPRLSVETDLDFSLNLFFPGLYRKEKHNDFL